MERFVLVDWRNKWNGCLTKPCLQIHAVQSDSSGVLHRRRQSYLKIHLETRETPVGLSNPAQKSTGGGLNVPGFKLHYRAIVLEITGHQPKSRLSGPEQRAPFWGHITTVVWILTKMLKMHIDEKAASTTNAAGNLPLSVWWDLPVNSAQREFWF